MNRRMGMVDEYQHLNAANFSTKTLDLMYHEEFSRVYLLQSTKYIVLNMNNDNASFNDVRAYIKT